MTQATDTMVEDVLFARNNGVLIITLNRPKALNALSLNMIRLIDPVLKEAATDPAISCVVMEGAGEKAFCAGGDVRAVVLASRDPSSRLGKDFFREEYILNHRIHTYPKPFISLIRGISMGGGVGLSVHGSHRVIDAGLTFAMPETGIGLFPDVGGTWFLNRCPGETGMYLGLTGARLKMADALYVGYGTHAIQTGAFDAVRDALVAASPKDKAGVDAVLAGFAADVPAAPLAEQQAMIDRCFGGASVEEIVAALQADGSDLAQALLKELGHKSPLALKVTFAQLRGGKDLTIEQVLTREYRMSQHALANGEFAEGIRALLIDKDQQPKWRPATIEAVTAAAVENYFAALGDEDLRFA